METTNLDKFLHTVRRIEEHREEKAVNQLKKLYKRLIKDLQSHLGTVYAKYSDENGLLTYARLHKDALDARLLQEVASKMNDVTQAEKRLITELVEQTYSNVYSGMVQAVDKAVDDKDLVTTFAQVQSAKPQALRAAVNNPVHGLTLSAQLEKNRANIIYGIQQAVGIGLSVGDRYDTMAKRVQKTLIGDDGTGGSYAKSIRIIRTEAHRVREQGNQDAAKELNNRLEPKGFVMVKTWHTMKDERVRPNVSRKTKKGWKYSIGNGKYNHVKMEGQSVLVNEPFTLPSGVTAMSPGMSGVAGEDINCRCFVSCEVRKIQGLHAGISIDKGHKPPEFLEHINLSEKEVLKTLKKYEKIIRKEPIENAIVVTLDGDVIRCFGDLDGVYPEVDLGDKLIGAYMTHNHPPDSRNEYSFSDSDIELFNDYKLNVLRGIDEKYVYEMSRSSYIDQTPEDWRDFYAFRHVSVIEKAKSEGFGYRRWEQ
nr:phage minor head protein [uncultured Lachnoanaerobaculum sp.]